MRYTGRGQPVQSGNQSGRAPGYFQYRAINFNVGIGTTSPSALLHVWGDAKVNTDLTVSGTIFQATTGSTAADHVMDTYDDLHNLYLYDHGRFAEMDAPIFADEARTVVDSRKLKQLEHGALRQLLKRIEELEEKIRSLQEVLEEKGKRQIISSLR